MNLLIINKNNTYIPQNQFDKKNTNINQTDKKLGELTNKIKDFQNENKNSILENTDSILENKVSKTKKKINALPEKNLKLNPGRKGNLNNKNAIIWIQNHHEDLQSPLKRVVEKIEYIGEQNFKNSLTACVNKLNNTLNTSKLKNEVFTILTAEGKSNKWVFDLIKPKLNECKIDYQEEPLGETYAKEFKLNYAENKVNSLPKNIILFDDASYSGTQIFNHVTTIIDMIKSIKPTKNIHDYKIFVVVPFITTTAEEKIKKVHSHFKVNLISDKYMKTMGELISKEDQKVLEKTLWSRGDVRYDTCSLTYFSHKIANFMSFPAYIAQAKDPKNYENDLSFLRTPSTDYINGKREENKTVESQKRLNDNEECLIMPEYLNQVEDIPLIRFGSFDVQE